MLDQKDLDIFKEMLETIAEKSEESILNKVDERLGKSKNLILDEMEKTRMCI